MNEITEKKLKQRNEKVLEQGIETCCPRCSNKKAEIIKTEHYFVLDCSKCNFSMGSPRMEAKENETTQS